jgi:hypothetical protein
MRIDTAEWIKDRQSLPLDVFKIDLYHVQPCGPEYSAPDNPRLILPVVEALQDTIPCVRILPRPYKRTTYT